MGNHGKVQRVIRELVATLVDELGPEEAAQRLETAAAQLRGTGRNHKQGAGQEHAVPSIRPRVIANR